MNLLAGIVGIDQWEKFTLPAYNSIKGYCDAVVIDNGSEPPYPFGKRIERTSYAAAINYIFGLAEARWYLILNNDVLCTGPIVTEFCDPFTMYGRKVRRQAGVEWIDTWCLMISRQVIDIVGKFDEDFSMVGFEDADYCIRAKKQGIPVAVYPFPLVHLADSSRWKLPGYSEQREKNIALLKAKHGVTLSSEATVHE